MNFLYVFLGGGLGSICRYGIGLLVGSQNEFPWATLVANALSSLIIGMMMGYLLSRGTLDSSLRLLGVVGFCGGFSTFSTFSYENYMLLQNQAFLALFLNILGSVSVCLLCIYLGMKICST